MMPFRKSYFDFVNIAKCLITIIICCLLSSCSNLHEHRKDKSIVEPGTKIGTNGVRFIGYAYDIDSTSNISTVVFNGGFHQLSINIGCDKCQLPKKVPAHLVQLRLYNNNYKYNTCNFDSLLMTQNYLKSLELVEFTGIDFTSLKEFKSLRFLSTSKVFFYKCKLTTRQIDSLISLDYIVDFSFNCMNLKTLPRAISQRENVYISLVGNDIRNIDTTINYGNNIIRLDENPLDSATIRWCKTQNTKFLLYYYEMPHND